MIIIKVANKFLRHINRTKKLIALQDVSGTVKSKPINENNEGAINNGQSR
jgi:GTPase involved in cell partitioning and DNA repair